MNGRDTHTERGIPILEEDLVHNFLKELEGKVGRGTYRADMRKILGRMRDTNRAAYDLVVSITEITFPDTTNRQWTAFTTYILYELLERQEEIYRSRRASED